MARPRRAPTFLALLALVLVASPLRASAQAESAEGVGAPLERASLRLRYGVSLREGLQVDPGPGLTYSGLTPNDLAAWAIIRGLLGPEWLGVQARVQREGFSLLRETDRVLEGSLLRVSAGLVARLRLGPVWGELSAGYGFTQLPVFGASESASPVFQRGGRQAALVGGRLRFPILGRVQGEVRGELPVTLTAQAAAGEAASSSGFAAGASLLIPMKRVGRWEGALVLDYEYVQDKLTADSGARSEQTLQRMGVALELAWLDAEDSASLPSARQPGSLALQVLDAETGAPLAGAAVTLVVEGAPRPPREADAQGQVVEQELAPGPVVAQVSAEGYESAEARVTVGSGERATLEVRARKLAPTVGGLKIVVVDKRNNQPLPDVAVVVGDQELRTNAAGQVHVAGLAPGPVVVKASAPDFQAVEEAAVIVAGKESEMAVPLAPAKRVGYATIAGRVRSTLQGRPLVATLVISTAKVRTRTDAQGAFSLKLKPGTYRISISAKGHLTQIKSVTVRDGEQAIFNVDLFPRGR